MLGQLERSYIQMQPSGLAIVGVGLRDDAEASTYANPSALVSTDWVQQHIDDPAVRLLEIDVDTSAYDRGHVRGSVGINWTTQLNDPVKRDILSRQAFERLMRQAGVDNDTRLVLYGDNNNWFAAFAYWIARLYGHHNLALMDGGRKKWELESRELVGDLSRVQPSAYTASEPDVRIRAFVTDVLRRTDETALVDVRSPAEFAGEILAPPGLPEAAQRPGHIPGAQNIPWAEPTNDDGTFKSPEQLRELYARKSITSDKPVITYCRIGERSSHTWFVLTELLGFPDVRNYDGSWTEYGSLIGVPIDNPSARAESESA
jgi:thiosulfate/3-mercaptopyruvate sulfurtransferase